MVKGVHKEDEDPGSKRYSCEEYWGSNFLEEDMLWESEKETRRLTQFS